MGGGYLGARDPVGDKLERYARQLELLGAEGQDRLGSSSVAIVGLGGLGSVAALYLAAAGVGSIKLVDRGRVEPSDLDRQILHWTKDVGKRKASSAYEKLTQVNPHVDIVVYDLELDEDNVDIVLKHCSVVLDGLDNWRTRFLVNNACVKLGIPLIHARGRGFGGELLVIIPGKTACLRCILPRAPKRRESTSTLGVVAGILGMLQAVEAIKLLSGIGEVHAGKLMIYDGLTQELTKIGVRRNPQCPSCGRIGRTTG